MLNVALVILLILASYFVKEVERRGLQVAVSGIPKTIDNDIAVNTH
jgi:6-phosphofructokinase